MPQSTRESIRRRLEDERAHRKLSKSEFQRQMEKTGARGSTYASIHAYLDPAETVMPSVEFLEAAAGVLGVRPAWLVFGDGERTEAEQRAVEARRGTGVNLAIRNEVLDAFLEEFPPFARLNRMEQFRVWHVWRFVQESHTKWAIEALEPPDEDFHYLDPRAEPDPSTPSLVEAARMVGRALQGPLDVLDIAPERVSDLELHRYVETACDALLFLLDQDDLKRLFRRSGPTRIDR